jgi:bifunctional DNA primase/polymerase-like protein/CHC2-type zinc finger protein
MTPKQTALFWLSQGIATVPLCYRSKKPLVPWTEFKTRLPALAQIDMWYQSPRNIAIVSGWQGLAILDFDTPESYSAWYCWHLEHNQDVLNTYRVMSNRGIHVYYYLREPIRLNSIQSALFEVKGSGRLCTTPPSVHESGKRYTSFDNPENIRTVKPDEILNYSPVRFEPLSYPTLKVSKYAPSPINVNATQQSIVSQIKEKISILSFFPNATQIDNEGRFYRDNCPIHGKRNNFWLDKTQNICGCFAGCGTFDVVSLTAKMQGISMSEAVNILRRML